MNRLVALWYACTPYTDARERVVAGFFRGLTERSKRPRIQTKLRHLVQNDIAAINLWSEYRYKGYTYLHKSERKRLYANLQLIANDFDSFYQARDQNDSSSMVLLRALTAYFSPRRGVYRYRESSSFGRLLRNPKHETLVGDCNQIVTLYVYLYSRYRNVRELRIRELPGHVALHCDGVDIETTTGSFTDYSHRKQSTLLPVEELVSINLLDTTDSYLATHQVDARDFLQAARLAYILSHNRRIVTQNLRAAYSELVNSLIKHHRYDQALSVALYSRNRSLSQVVGHNGALYLLRRNDFKGARRFARHAGTQASSLTNDAWRAEGAYYYAKGQYKNALKAFKQLNDQKLVRHCYEALFFEEQATIDPKATTDSLKRYAGTIRRMRHYAKKSGNKKLITHANKLNTYVR